MSQIAWSHFFIFLNLKNQIMLSTSPQTIPQYIEVPPNIEVTLIISCFSVVFFCWSNRLLLKNESDILIFYCCWQAPCRCSFLLYLFKTGDSKFLRNGWRRSDARAIDRYQCRSWIYRFQKSQFVQTWIRRVLWKEKLVCGLTTGRLWLCLSQIREKKQKS